MEIMWMFIIPIIFYWHDACDPIIYTPEITPCYVLDPFAGSGTTARWRSSLAQSHRIELNPKYVGI